MSALADPENAWAHARCSLGDVDDAWVDADEPDLWRGGAQYGPHGHATAGEVPASSTPTLLPAPGTLSTPTGTTSPTMRVPSVTGETLDATVMPTVSVSTPTVEPTTVVTPDASTSVALASAAASASVLNDTTSPSSPTATATANSSATLPPSVLAPSLAAAASDPQDALSLALGSPNAATVMATTGVVSTTVAGLFSPGAANKGNSLSRLVQVADCHAPEGDSSPGDDEEDEVMHPPWHQYVLPVPLHVGGSCAGAVRYRKANGALLSTSVVLVASFAACIVVALRCAPHAQRPRKYTGVLFAVMLSFYGPNVVALATSIFTLPDANFKGLAIVGNAIAVSLLAVATWLMARLSQDAAARVHAYFTTYDDTAAATESGPTADEHARLPTALGWLMTPMVESARDPVPQHVRLHVVEDILAAFLVAVIGGAQLPAGASCVGPAMGMLGVSVLHALYVILVRPYRDQVEQGFAALIAVLQCVVAGAMVAGLLAPGASGRVAAFTAAGWAALVLNVTFYAQLVVLAGIEIRRLRRQLKHATSAPDEDSHAAAATAAAGTSDGDGAPPADSDAADAPLLANGLAALEAVPVAANPLVKAAAEPPRRPSS